MWIAHWGLHRDPFGDPMVLTCLCPVTGGCGAAAPHDRVGGWLAVLSAAAGMGKTRVLGQAVARHGIRCAGSPW